MLTVISRVGASQNLAHAVVEPQLLGRVVEAGFRRQPRILFLFGRQYRHIACLYLLRSLPGFQNRFERLLNLADRICASTSSPFSTPSARL